MKLENIKKAVELAKKIETLDYIIREDITGNIGVCRGDEKYILLPEQGIIAREAAIKERERLFAEYESLDKEE